MFNLFSAFINIALCINSLLDFSYYIANFFLNYHIFIMKYIRLVLSERSGKWNFVTLILKNVLYFLKESCSFILGDRNPEKMYYILGNGIFLYFR